MLPMSKVTILSAVGSVLVLFGAIFMGCFPVIFNSVLENLLILTDSSATLDAFLVPPVPIYMQFYLFNVTNPQEIRNYGAKPIIQEVGPFTYLESRQKYDLVWKQDEGTVKYFQNKTYIYESTMSVNHNTNITTINAVMVVLADMVSENTQLSSFLWPEIEQGMDLFETHTADEWLFKGFLLPEFNFDFSGLGGILPALQNTSGLNGTIYEILTMLGLHPPEFLKENRIGYFFGKNNTNDGSYTVRTGQAGMSDYQEITKWNDDEMLHWWSDPFCDMINGTDGAQYSPHITKDRVLYIYTSDFCRSLYLTFEYEHQHEGITVYRFVPPREMLEDPLINYDNLCYCYPDINSCLGAGFLNLEPCALGAPVIMSTPHFFEGDTVELAKLIGLNPNKAEHETVLDVEPTTGVTLHAEKKIQINVPLKRYGNLPTFMNVPEVIFPVMWVNESAEVVGADAEAFKKGLTVPFIVVDVICGFLIVVGVVLLVIAGRKFQRIRRNGSKHV